LLVIPGADRGLAIPEVPTAKELGLNVEIEFFRGLSVPKGTPAAIKEKIANAMIQAANSKAFTNFAQQKGFTIALLSPTEFEAYLSRQNEIVKETMKKIGIYQSKRNN
jgi:tripartite-type tricarboxylate transporter receptor subunit TctC